MRDSHLARREALTAVNALAEPLTVEELLPPIPDKPPVTRPVLEGQHLVGIITELPGGCRHDRKPPCQPHQV